MRELQITRRVLDLPCWYVVHTHALQEGRAEKNLNMWGIETFNPRLRDRRQAIKALFPCYIFAWFNAGLMLHKIGFTRGVRNIVRFNGMPAPVPEEVVDLIRLRVGEDGFVRVCETLRSGDRVVVRDGPLSHLEGIFEKDVNDADRVLVLLTTVNYQSRVIIDRQMLKKVS
jgi:transcriptional antiterminator RfaH